MSVVQPQLLLIEYCSMKLLCNNVSYIRVRSGIDVPQREGTHTNLNGKFTLYLVNVFLFKINEYLALLFYYIIILHQNMIVKM